MNKLKKITLAVIVGIMFSATSAYAFNKSDNKLNKNIITADVDNNKLLKEKNNQGGCCGCLGCNGNCVLK